MIESKQYDFDAIVVGSGISGGWAAKELTEKGGYGIAETAGDNVMRISPHIVDLDVEPGTIINDIGSHEDMLPTLMAAVGEPDIKEKLLKGHEAAGKKFKVHLDGYDQSALLKGRDVGSVLGKRPRKDRLPQVCSSYAVHKRGSGSFYNRSGKHDAALLSLYPTCIAIVIRRPLCKVTLQKPMSR